jgi:hypothetical protein
MSLMSFFNRAYDDPTIMPVEYNPTAMMKIGMVDDGELWLLNCRLRLDHFTPQHTQVQCWHDPYHGILAVVKDDRIVRYCLNHGPIGPDNWDAQWTRI